MVIRPLRRPSHPGRNAHVLFGGRRPLASAERDDDILDKLCHLHLFSLNISEPDLRMASSSPVEAVESDPCKKMCHFCMYVYGDVQRIATKHPVSW